MKMTKRGLETKDISEVGVTRGLVAYYPLMGDTKDYAGTNDATNNGATATAEGYEFNNGAYLDLPNDVGYTTQVSVFALFKELGTPGNSHHIIFGGSELEVSISTGDYLRTGIETSSRYVSNHGSGLLDGNWHQVGFTFDGSIKTAYIDGVAVGTLSVTGTLINSFTNRRIGVYGSTTSYYTNGLIRDARIHNVALTPEEVAIQYNLALNEQTKTMMTDGCLYTTGQFKEVIS